MLIPHRQQTQPLTQEEKLILQEFLTYLTNTKGILVIANTNYLENIDIAIIRDGRLGNHIEFHLPMQDDITDIIENLFTQYKKTYNDDVSELALQFSEKNTATIRKFFTDYFEFAKENNISVHNKHSIASFIDEFGF